MNEMKMVNPSGGCMSIRFTKAQIVPAIALLLAGLLLPQRAAGQDAVKKGQGGLHRAEVPGVPRHRPERATRTTRSTASGRS